MTLPGEPPNLPPGATLDLEPAAAHPLVVPTTDPLLFELHERYELSGQLGSGGMGDVRLCRDRQIGRTVAMKVIREARVASPEARARFIHEARVQGQLEHPAVVPVYDLGINPDERVWFTMKRVRGVSLEAILDTLSEEPDDAFAEQFSRRRLLSAFSRICLAVDFAHRRGVVHRDLKPANLMLGDFGEAYVLDWGVAKLMAAVEEEPSPADTGRLAAVVAAAAASPAVGKESGTGALELPADTTHETIPGTILGSPGYISPEQLQGGEVGPRSDIYALGSILFEILALDPLHHGRTPILLMASTLRGVDARPSLRAPDLAVPPELDAICVKATQLDPSARHASARELHEAVERYLDGARDEEQRRMSSAVHAAEAEAAADRAETEDDAPLEDRRRAMRAAGRALALDPSNPEALHTMVRLLTHPPARTPPEVAMEQRRTFAHQTRWNARAGAYSYATVLALAAYFPWVGVGSWAWYGVFVALMIASLALSVWQGWLHRAPSHAMVLLTFVVSSLAFATIASAYGPLVLAPVALAANTAAYATNIHRRVRPFAIAFGCALVGVTALLERLGALPAHYEIHGATMSLHPGLTALPETATMVFLTFAAMAAILATSLVVSRSRDLLHDAERKIMTYAWHLRELVPSELREATDPTRDRRFTGPTAKPRDDEAR